MHNCHLYDFEDLGLCYLTYMFVLTLKRFDCLESYSCMRAYNVILRERKQICLLIMKKKVWAPNKEEKKEEKWEIK